MTRAYIRPSVAYRMTNGLVASSTVTAIATRVSAMRRTSSAITARVTSENRTESERTATSLSPNSVIQPCRSK